MTMSLPTIINYSLEKASKMFENELTDFGKKRVKFTKSDERNLKSFLRPERIKKCAYCKEKFIIPGQVGQYAYKVPHSYKGFWFFCRYNHMCAWKKERENHDKRRKESKVSRAVEPD